MTTNLGPWPGNLYPPVRAHATANITPFTYYDGLSFLEVLEALRAWLRETLIPGLDGIIEIVDGMIQAALENVEIDLEVMRQELNDALESIDATDAELREYVDLVLQQVIDNSIEVQDPVVSGLIEQSDSMTRVSLDERIVFNVQNIMKDYGAVGDGIADDTDAVAAALLPPVGDDPDNLAVPTGEFRRIRFPKGIYNIRPGVIEWDMWRAVIDGEGAVFAVAGGYEDAAAIRAYTSAPRLNGTSGYTHVADSGRFIIRQTSQDREGVGILFQGSTEGNYSLAAGYRLAAHFTLSNVVITGFDTAVVFDVNSYMCGFRDAIFNDCHRFVVKAESANSGERLFFDGCNFTNQTTGYYGAPANAYQDRDAFALDMQGDQSFVFNNCSFDWVIRLLRTVGNSQIYFSQCHFETPLPGMLRKVDQDAGDAYIVTNSYSMVSFDQCRFLFAGNTTRPEPLEYLANINAWATMSVSNSMIYTARPFMYAWANNGNIRLSNVQTFQPAYSRTLPLRTLTRKHSYSPPSYTMDTLDGRWTFTGGTESGELVSTPAAPDGAIRSLVIGGANTVGRLRVSARGSVNHLGFWCLARTDAATGADSVIIRTRLRDNVGNQISAAQWTYDINATEWTPVYVAYSTQQRATARIESADVIDYEIQNPVGGGKVYISKVVVDSWE